MRLAITYTVPFPTRPSITNFIIVLFRAKQHTLQSTIIAYFIFFTICSPSQQDSQLHLWACCLSAGSCLPRLDSMDANISQHALSGTFGLYYSGNGSMVVVEMGEVDIVNFAVCPAIGTYGLNGCSVALIASPYASILAHIPPRPDLTNADPHAGDNNTRAIMVAFAQIYQTYADFFPTEESYIICAAFAQQNGPALEDHVAIIQAAFLAMGLTPEIRHYEIPVDHGAQGEGTVVVSNGQDLAPTVYVQDVPV